MSDLEPSINQGRRISQIALWVFAFVGFLAAVVQISSYFSVTGSQLRVSIEPHTADIPQSLLKAVRDEGDSKGYLTALANDDETFFCDSRKIANVSSGDGRTIQSACLNAKGLKSALMLMRGFDGSTKYFDYTIENVGSSIAREIRLAGPNVYAVDQVGQSRSQGHSKNARTKTFIAFLKSIRVRGSS